MAKLKRPAALDEATLDAEAEVEDEAEAPPLAAAKAGFVAAGSGEGAGAFRPSPERAPFIEALPEGEPSPDPDAAVVCPGRA